MTMRLLRALAVVGLIATPAAADQNDPRLDQLFAVIQTTDDAETANAATNLIWAIWTHSEEDDVRRLMSLGIEAMRIRDYPDALRYFDRIVEVEPDFAEGWNKRATAYYLMRELDLSVADIERTLALEPRHFGAISGMGLIFLAREDFQGALDAFRAVLEIHPRSPSAHFHVEQLEKILKGRAA